MAVPAVDDRDELSCDVLVIGGGTAGTMAALTAGAHGARVLLLEKAHVRHSGALAMGMDGVNNAVLPGLATPEDYVAEITRANDGIVNQRTVMRTATRGHAMVRRLEGYGVKFEKDEHGEYAVRQVHRSGSYVLPMPEGRDIKKVLYRELRRRENRERITIENRLMPVRVLTAEGRAVGAVALHTRTGRFTVVRAGAVILATGAAGRLGLPASGYLYGTYENPTNAGDGHAMAYHAGAELSNIECFQVNPLIKDYNGPACAYVANPFGGYQVNADGDRFVDCDYWSGQMMAEVKREIDSARGPIYLKLTHLPEETVSALENILHTTERPTRGTFHAGRGHDYRTHDVEMHISEIGLCGGHSGSGVWVDENAATTVPGLYAAGDLACVPHNYMIGAFVYGDLAGQHAAEGPAKAPYTGPLPDDQIAAAHALVYRPLHHPDGPPQSQVEYKLRRFVNDYVAPPKSDTRLAIAVETFDRMRDEIAAMGGRTPHELMRCLEVDFIRDCAEMAARASLAREESRWGLYHQRVDTPERDDRDWLFHLNLRKGPDGAMEFVRRDVEPYLVPVEEFAPPTPADPNPRPLAVASPRPHRRTAPGEPSTPARAPEVRPTHNPRVIELLALAEESPTLAAIAPYLGDPDPTVRRTAVATLTETTPDGFATALAGRFDDPDPDVRAATATSLRELAEILPASDTADGDGLRDALATAATAGDATVRAAALDLLRVLRHPSPGPYLHALDDPETAVRLEAVRGLVSLDATAALARPARDAAREVRVAAAKALGTLGDPAGAPTLAELAADADPFVRAAALSAAASVATPSPLDALARAALSDPAWQVREGAVRALAATDDHTALLPPLTDRHPNVRRAAVICLEPHAHHPDVTLALTASLTDKDADVRAFTRRALDRSETLGSLPA
ncbi:fumarate reductase/succinate dehydrogenase flavoprotein subunit [Yinghuangia sp. ASG 101]|uniref:fumarate reductase/succinate dehydrogenase flavoprotein subunit n=1 Tax=Yinghuangia sp. ASG 101 TaxID=2896848 RepID=UPI001E5BA3CB|nr:fumarate reductase/succinate dehydrogenase flavoprotein subunit [Yinghuangia sp. ASG 101]UGQ15308.1 fumarate reductase/succinate dehydrogenase flavoprotein subunit [Yinghuangia sp. ASG 101]